MHAPKLRLRFLLSVKPISVFLCLYRIYLTIQYIEISFKHISTESHASLQSTRLDPGLTPDASFNIDSRMLMLALGRPHDGARLTANITRDGPQGVRQCGDDIGDQIGLVVNDTTLVLHEGELVANMFRFHRC